jgi:hypothetical protein
MALFSITEPLALPTLDSGLPTKPRTVTLHMEQAVGRVVSPLSYSEQVQVFAGKRWRASWNLPPMERADAEQWLAFLARCNGPERVFLAGDPNAATARGTPTGTPLVEYRNNLLLQSEDFTTTWTTSGTGTITADQATAPDGNTTADRLEDTAAGNIFAVIQPSITVGDDAVSRCFSVYFKEGTTQSSVIRLTYSGGTGINGSVRLTWATHATSISSGALDDFGVEDVGEGWYRLWGVLANNSTGNTSLVVDIILAGGGASFTGYVDTWGAQLSESAVPVSYLKTTTAAVSAEAPSAGGEELYSDGWTAATVILKAGDYISVGSGTTTRLYKIMQDVTSDAQGCAELHLWPTLREVPADNAAIAVADCTGAFRLFGGPSTWNVDDAQFYGLQFSAIEAVP